MAETSSTAESIAPEFAAILKTIKSPDGRDLLAAGLVVSARRLPDAADGKKKNEKKDAVAQVILEVPAVAGGDKKTMAAYQELKKTIEKKLLAMAGVKRVMVIITMTKAAGAPTPAAQTSPFADQKPIPQVKKIIAVASGKGGVGKSTTAFNLALALARRGAGVALLDADIYGPSIPTLAGCAGQKPLDDGAGNMVPISQFDMEINSIGFLLAENQPTIWRGPMVMSALTQLLFKTAWGSVLGPRDIMVVDLPPGTGDAQLTLIQRVPLSGAVIVSTPQDLALIDATRAIAMFEKLNIPLLGLIENMSYFVCDQCGKEHDIFARGGAVAAAKKFSIPLLGEVPLTPALRAASDEGQPLAASDPVAEVFAAIAERVIAGLD